jgi:hypothetical protein
MNPSTSLNPIADLLILWSWEYDDDFVRVLSRTCDDIGVNAQVLKLEEKNSLAQQLESKEVQTRIVLDRVWDWGGEYEKHVDAVKQYVPLVLNDYDLVRRIWNKVDTHYRLLGRGFRVPHTLVLPSHEAEPNLMLRELNGVGKMFSIKAKHSGGSGVLKPESSWVDVLKKRMEWANDETLIQEWIEPRLLGTRRAWFRVFYACGATYPCWQDDRTHIQQPITPEEENLFKLDALRGMTQHIASICGLNLFSTEIALDERNRWVVVDYVNDPCDFRLKSTIANGVPDEIIQSICRRIARWSKKVARVAEKKTPTDVRAVG